MIKSREDSSAQGLLVMLNIIENTNKYINITTTLLLTNDSRLSMSSPKDQIYRKTTGGGLLYCTDLVSCIP